MPLHSFHKLPLGKPGPQSRFAVRTQNSLVDWPIALIRDLVSKPALPALTVATGACALINLATYLNSLHKPVQPYGPIIRSKVPPLPGGEVIQLSHGECHYILEGSESSGLPLIVLAHGLVGSTCYLKNLASYLVQKGRRVLRIDFYGRGRSSAPALPNTPNLFAGQLAELLFALRETNPIDLIGYSMGGAVCGKFAALYPKTLNSLVLIAPAGTPSMRSAIPFILRLITRIPKIHRVNLLDHKLLDVQDERFTEWKNSNSEKWEGYVQAETTRLKHEREVLRQCFFSAIKHFDWGGIGPDFETIGKSGMRVLVLWGEKDSRVPASGAKQLAGFIPQAKIIMYPDSFHSLPIEEPEVVGDAIVDFYDSDVPSQSSK